MTPEDELKRTRERLSEKRRECRKLQDALGRQNSAKVRELRRHAERLTEAVADAVQEQARAVRKTRELQSTIDKCRRIIAEQVGAHSDDLVELVTSVVAHHIDNQSRLATAENDLRREQMENAELRRDKWGQA